jgi:general stress protein 26
MPNEADITAKFWKALKSDMTVMLGLCGVQEGHTAPMTAQLEDEAGRGPIWFFTAKDVNLVKAMGQSHAAGAQFVSKGHDVFASVQGTLSVDNDRAMIDRLWNRFVAAWYPGGKEDPKLTLLRFDPTHAHVWLNENSLFAGIKILMGSDPKKDYKDKVADVNLGSSQR